MRQPIAILLGGALAGAAWAQLPMHAPPIGTRGTVASYVGPLDAISAAAKATIQACYSFRACSANAASTNAKSAQLNHTGTMDITVLSTGKFDVATANPFCGGSLGGCTLQKTYDQSGNANTLTTTAASTMQTVATCGITAPCVLVSGDGGMGVTSTFTSFTADPETMSWVVQRRANFSSFGEVISMRTNAAFACDSGSNNSTNHVFDEGTSLFTATASDSAWHAVQATVTNGAGASVLNVDGTETTGTTGHCNATPITVVGVGTNPPSGGNPFSGWIVEALIFSSALSASDRTALCQNQQSSTYGFGTGNFPANC